MDDLKFYTRLSKITLKNFKNIEYGTIEFPNVNYEDYFLNQKSSILGLYGQNGSGKSTLITAVKILRDVLLGRKVEVRGNFVRNESDCAELFFDFVTYDIQGNFFEIKYNLKCSVDSIFDKDWECYRFKGRIFDETIEYSGILANGNKLRKKTLISTREEFCSDGKKAFGTKQNTKIDKEYSQIINSVDSSFSKCTGEKWFLDCRNEIKDTSFFFNKKVAQKLAFRFSNFFDSCVYVALSSFPTNCFIIESNKMGNVTMDKLPLYFPKQNKASVIRSRRGHWAFNAIREDHILLNLQPGLVSDKNEGSFSDVVPKLIEKVSLIVDKIIPGLKIVVEQGGIFSVRDNIKIPLGLESDGIKRIVSIAATLSAAFNNPEALTIIDELDSGIFEDLLGNLLRVFSESAKGQLIFSSHNLRPLEVLPTECIRFTTTNPKNRFFKMVIKGNSNLRDSYRRALHVGGLKEELYNDPDNTEIKLAFMQDWSEDDIDLEGEGEDGQ